MKNVSKLVAMALLTCLATSALAADAALSPSVVRRANNLIAWMGITGSDKIDETRKIVDEYYQVAEKPDAAADAKKAAGDALIDKLSKVAPAEKVKEETPYIMDLLAMPLTGEETSLSDADKKYTTDLSGRADKIIGTLGMTDPAKTKVVHQLIADQYRAIHDNDGVRDAKVKAVGAAGAEAAKAQGMEARKFLHSEYLASLGKYLDAAQIEKVKDGHTSGKVEFTFRGYMAEYPNLNPEQQAKVIEFLKEARELGMDGGSSGEKDSIFNKYKGKINNWLSSQKVKSKKQIDKEAAAAATQPVN